METDVHGRDLLTGQGRATLSKRAWQPFGFGVFRPVGSYLSQAPWGLGTPRISRRRDVKLILPLATLAGTLALLLGGSGAWVISYL